MIYMGKQRERIVDLEQENAKMREEVELWKKTSGNNSYKAFQLEKENAELEAQIEELQKKFTEESNLNAEIKARFVKCNTCTKEMKKDCLMWTENLCEGERCN